MLFYIVLKESNEYIILIYKLDNSSTHKHPKILIHLEEGSSQKRDNLHFFIFLTFKFNA